MAVAWAFGVVVAWRWRCGGWLCGHGLMLRDISFNIVGGGSAKGLDFR